MVHVQRNPPPRVGPPSRRCLLALVVLALWAGGCSREINTMYGRTAGGGIPVSVNGTDVLNFPNGALSCTVLFCAWNSVSVTNNIIADNVAGWAG